MTAASLHGSGPPSWEPIEESVVVTGASGVVGSALVAELSNALCLTHLTPAAKGSHQVSCDLAQPRLALGRREWRELAHRTASIVHCAALTDFTASEDAIRRVNVTGTEHVLELAACADAPIYYVSTAFVERTAAYRRPPGGRDDGARASGADAYLASKGEAEALVRDSGLDGCIVRPSVVCGDSATGEIARFQGLHLLIGAVVRGLVPLLPLSPEARIDFLPQDCVARAIAALVRSRHTCGEYFLTAGEEALTAERVVEIGLELCDELGLEVSPPRLVEPELVDRLIRPAFIDALPKQAQERFDELTTIASLYHEERPFNSSTRALEGRLGVQLMPDLEDSFRRSMSYWAAKKRLRRRARTG